MRMSAIQTEYNGCLFRSRLEARYAVFFDALGIHWEYEPEGFTLTDGTYYLPDFRIKVNCRTTDEDGYVWIEVKGADSYFDIPFKDRKKIELFAEEKPIIVLGSLDAIESDETFMTFEFVDGDPYPVYFTSYNGEPWITGEDYDECNLESYRYAIDCAKHARFEFDDKPTFKPYSFFKTPPKTRPGIDEFLNFGQREEIVAPW